MLEDAEYAYDPSPLERLADAAGLGYWELWHYLEREVERVRRERYAMHSRAHADLDRRLEHGRCRAEANVALAGDNVVPLL